MTMKAAGLPEVRFIALLFRVALATLTLTTVITAVGAAAEGGSCSKLWQQCGGSDYIGAECCESGGVCERQSEYYSQCRAPVLEMAGINVETAQMTGVSVEAAPEPPTSIPGPDFDMALGSGGAVYAATCSSQWQQCGGADYTGPTTCCAGLGLSCVYEKPYYSQCKKTSEVPAPVTSPVPVNACINKPLSRCGGLTWTGTKCCPTGYLCTMNNVYWSDCQLPGAKITPSAVAPTPTPTTSVVCTNGPLQKCGGSTFKGATCCPTGYVCTMNNIYWWDCQLPGAKINPAPVPPSAVSPNVAAPTPSVVVAPFPASPPSTSWAHGIREMYPSLNTANDWVSNWTAYREFKDTYVPDTVDKRIFMKGSGDIKIGGDLLTMSGSSPRLYINAQTNTFWNNVEFTAYAKLPDGFFSSTFSGMTMVVRSRHEQNEIDPCRAHGYYARLWFTYNQIGIQKEFWHNADSNTNIYTNRIVNPVLINPADYRNKFFGMKYIVRTRPDQISVNLQLYIDTTEGLLGGDWVKVMDYNDYNWMAKPQTTTFPCSYSYAPTQTSPNTSPVLRPGTVGYLRTDAVNGLIWRDASMREIAPL